LWGDRLTLIGVQLFAGGAPNARGPVPRRVPLSGAG